MKTEEKSYNKSLFLLKGIFRFSTIANCLDFLIGLLLGIFFCFYGFYFLSIFKKKRIIRLGVYYGSLISIAVIILFGTSFLIYTSYLIDVRNNNRFSKKPGFSKMEIQPFFSYMSNKMRNVLHLNNAKKFVHRVAKANRKHVV